MDFFTQSVDASLQSSRAYDDPSYYEDPAAAAESLSPIHCDPLPTSPLPAKQLILSIGPVAQCAIHALQPPTPSPPPAFKLSGARIAPTDVMLCCAGPLVGCITVQVAEHGVEDNRAFAFAERLLDLVEVDSVFVVWGATRMAMGGWRNGVRILSTTALGQVEGVIKMEEPAFFGGLAGAVLAEAEMRGMKAVCVVGGVESVAGSVHDIMELLKGMKDVWAKVGELTDVGEVDVDAVKRAFGSRGESYQSIYM